jgi:CheY-like chemotaxis protein
MILDGKRILIVEDESLVAISLEYEIAGLGAEVVGTAGTVDVALAIIATTDLDGAVVDVKLKGRTAFAIADALADRHIPFVFTTGARPRDFPARHAGVPWLQKPFLPGSVGDALAGCDTPVLPGGA